MWSHEEDAALRVEAMQWLAVRTHDGERVLSTEEIEEFRFRGEPFKLRDRQRGIRKPKELGSALSITTVWRPEGAARPYEDDLGSDGLVRYKWRGDDPDHAENRALRAAMRDQHPLIWFWGVGTALYKPIFPIFLVDEEPTHHQFVVALDGMQHLRPSESPVEEILRRYLRFETTRRLHQPVFRSMVMRAYENHCAVCSLRHPVLLDAAHIVEDKHELGAASLRNGLSLCKIHHAAYDSGILGVTPDFRVQIRADILDEVDGPLLEYGLKGLHGDELRFLPRLKRERPDPHLLQIHFEKFLAG
ncbi:HNH endonuclease [Arsenicicoccus dermatophilus]|uniref:HNH endonuclease n=1 Tax=Arsenicicoccus dermatophilus TaxID=1076331 RepID=UPI001F4CA36F|nr:HNH endonuclease [Arsenicicoccus dermatophilus]MCH8614050.1 HNH endonuclease [Arsenicicoccus dermatophilus]